MFNPLNQPTLNPETNGKGRRYVLKTDIVRPMRLDRDSDDALLKAAAMLSNKEDIKDSVSCSMLTRLALRRFYSHLLQLTPPDLEREKRVVRMMSQRPGPPRKRPASATRLQGAASTAPCGDCLH